MDSQTPRPIPAASVEMKKESDPVVRILGFGIIFVLVVMLTGILYFLLTGVINPPAPRTALEAQEVMIRDAVQRTPGSGKAWADYIKTEMAMGDNRAAQELVDQARKTLKGDQLVFIELAAVDLLLDEGKAKEADKLADKLVKQDEQNRAKAIANLMEKGVQSPPKNTGWEIGVQALLAKAKTAGALADWDGAIKALTRAMELSPRSSDLMTLRANAYLRQNKTDLARKDLEQALKFAPDYEPALEGLKELDK